MNKIDQIHLIELAYAIIIFILLALASFFFTESTSLKRENLLLQNKLQSTESILSSTTEAKIGLENDLNQEKDKNNVFEKQINKISGTVGNLEKLSKTDKELLQKYSKVYFLNENYIPDSVTKIDSKFLYNQTDEEEIHNQVLPFLDDLLDEAQEDGIDLKIVSAYRSFGVQAGLKARYNQIYGAGSANQFSADQGYSEHQLGTTVDFTVAGLAGVFAGFDQTDAYKWLEKNAYKYGFVLSYPKNNTYYQYEPWHWRFVGTDLAERLHDEGKYFYDFDQRQIDTYLISIFD